MHIEAVADALQVSITDLTGQPYPPSDAVQARTLAAVPGIRATIHGTAFDEPLDWPARPIEVLLQVALAVEAARETATYASVAPQLATLIEELHVHVAKRGNDYRPALAALIGVYRTVFVLCKDLGFTDLGWIAADRMTQAARRLEEPALTALAEDQNVLALQSTGARARALHAAERAIDSTTSGLAHPRVMPVHGMLHLRAALVAAPETDLGADYVDAHLREAENIASRTGENNAFDLNFGPANVAAWRMSIAIERGDGGKAAEIVRDVNPLVFQSQRRRAYFYADLGRGLSQTRGKETKALTMLREAERLAPETIRTHPLVRETVTSMLHRARNAAGGRDLRGLAYRMGIT